MDQPHTNTIWSLTLLYGNAMYLAQFHVIPISSTLTSIWYGNVTLFVKSHTIPISFVVLQHLIWECYVTLCEAPCNPWNKARPQHREFHPLLFSYFIQKDKTLLLIVIFFLTVVNLIGDSHTNEVYIFQLWGVIEMHWLNYSAPKSLLNEILQKYQKSIHMWKIGKFCFLTWYPKIQLAIFTFVWRLLLEELIFCCWSWILCIHVGF